MDTIRGISVFTGREIELELEGGRIRAVREPEEPTAEGGDRRRLFVSPGFFDIQVNGYRGSDYSRDELCEDDLRVIHSCLAAAGTTQHVPTMITSPQKRLVRNLGVIAEVLERDPLMHAAIPGVHIEGPYVSSEDGARGVHDASHVRDPDFAEFEEWRAASGNRIVMVTLAPERCGAIPFIEKVTELGVIVAIGHTAAEPETIRRAVQAGARLSTHLGNGSHLMMPRLQNYIWEQLAQDDLHASIICDGHHLPDSVVRVFRRSKGLSRLILVSDAALLGGREPGIYKWNSIDVQVFPDGHLGLPGTTLLAGAAHLLDWDVAHFHRFTGVSLGEVIRLCTENPARLLGLEAAITSVLRAGEPANLTVFEYSGGEQRLHIRRTICGGREVYHT